MYIDFSGPRNAWIFAALKEGTHMRAIVPDGDYARVDPARLFSPSFPPTCFIHGTADETIDVRFSVRAHEDLCRLGVKTELVLVEGQDRGFDMFLREDEKGFEVVRGGLRFLERYVVG